MSLIAKDLPTLIFLLLPGFISAGVFYTLTAHPKTSEFERLIQSLIFTAFVRIGVGGLKPQLFSLGRRGHSYGPWNEDVEFGWSIVVAIVIGLIFAFMSNKDIFHSLVRWMRLTNRTSYPSEWYGTFSKRGRVVVLHLDGERRLKGWPSDWPDQPDKGHFVIRDPAWILEDEQVSPIHEDDRILIPATEVKMVEFLKWPEELTEDVAEISKARQLLIDARKRAEGKSDGSESPAESP